MGIVSGAALGAGGDVVGVIPHAILSAGGEGEQENGDGSSPVSAKMEEEGREMVGVIRFHDIPLTDVALRWNGYERPSR
jgi:hypothetical protein